MQLANVGNITLIHRRKYFRGLESSINKLKNLKNVQILTPYLPKTIELDNNQLSIGLKLVGSKEMIHQNFDEIVVAYGFKANNNFVKNWGIDLVHGRIIPDRTMQTNQKGIYAIGDIVNYPGRIPVIGVGFGEAQIAINAIVHSLFPEKTTTIHSTSL